MSFLFRSEKKTTHNPSEERRHLYFLEDDAIAILPAVAGRLQQLTTMPKRTDIHEWLATNTLAFFAQVNVQVEVVSQLCTQTTCPVMSAGSHSFDLESDKKKKVKMHAKQYIDTVMINIQKQIQDEQIFPTKFGSEFPLDFIQIIRKIFRQYYIILAHIYFHHFHEFKRLQLHDGLNTFFLHFTYFVTEFTLLEPKDLTILEELVVRLKHHEEVLAKRPRSDDYSDAVLISHSLSNS